jgi:cap1 methyltransferase
MSTSTVSGSDEEDQDNGGSITNYTSAFRPFERNSSSSTTSTSDSPDHDTDGNHVDQLRKRALNAGADDDLPSKKIKGTYSEFSMKMMASMGYIPGQGLGRENTGIVDPIQESLHKGRQGLGFNLEGLEREDVQWELEEVSYVQSPVWLPSCTLEVLTADDMEEWITFGDKKDTIEDENLYCDEEILKKILNSKVISSLLLLLVVMVMLLCDIEECL